MERKRDIVLLLVIALLVSCVPALGQTPEELVAIRRAFADALDAHDLDAIASYFTEDGVFDCVSEPAPYADLEQIRAAFGGGYIHSPDWHTDEGVVLAADNIVVVEHAALGTQTGSLPGLPATGKAWTVPHVDIYEFEGDKIKRLTSYSDNAGFYIQVGLMPAPEMPDLTPSVDVPDAEATGLSPLEANAELIRRWNSHDAALVAKMDRADAKIFAGPLGTSVDRVAMMALNELYFTSFPDDVLEVVRTVDLGEGWVLTELVSHATQLKPFMGVPAAGYPVEIRLVWLTRYDSGLVTEMSFYYDNLTLVAHMTEEPEYSPAGTWVSTIPTPVGNTTLLHTVIPQEKMGGPYAGIMHQVNTNPTLFGMFPDVESNSAAWVTQTVRTGRYTTEGTMLSYGMKKGESPLLETVTIAIAHVKSILTGPDTNEGEAMLSMYLAGQDADGDGFPDEGQAPVVCITYPFTSRRLTMMPPCIPTPLPEQ